MSAADFLAAVEARANAATRGPWCMWTAASPSGERSDGISPEGMPEFDVCETPRTPAGRENAVFIAHARTDVPRLVAALRAVLDVCARGEANSFGDSLVDVQDVEGAIEGALTDAS